MIQNLIPQLEVDLHGKGVSVSIESFSTVSGGSINDAFVLKTSGRSFFLKVNSSSKYPHMFERELEGLMALRQPDIIHIPKPILTGENNDQSYIIMAFIEGGSPGPNFWNDFGHRIARLHQMSNDQFGFENDNYIGSLSQSNKWHESWPSFFIHERLEPLAKKARDMGELTSEEIRKFDKLFVKLEDYFPTEKPSLIHGDLWSGNYMSDENGHPVIFDPAVYYGHREMDIGMSKLFGGFSPTFYDTYNETYPLENGWQERLDVANLYPLLVHVILFGGSYAYDVKRILQRMT